MKRIHCFDGDKGGVGKSFAATVKIQHCLDRNLPFVPVEADRYNPDVANRYGHLEFQFAVFSEDEKISTRKEQENPDRIVDFAVEKDVVISLPAQVGLPFNKWLDTAVIACEEMDVQIVRWFLSSGTFESLELFARALKRHGKMMPFVLVKNWALSDDWSELEENKDMQKLIKQFSVQVIDFPKLEWREANLIQKKNLTFAEARESRAFHSMQRTRIKAFLKKAYSAFESTGLVLDVP